MFLIIIIPYIARACRAGIVASFDNPHQMRRFHRFGLLSLAFKGPMRRTALFWGLYRIRQTRQVRALMRSILRSHSFSSDWQSISGLQQHPMLRRVFNHKNDRDSGMSRIGATEQGLQVGEKFPNNTPDGVLVYVRHANEHGSDGPRPEDLRPEEEEEDEGAVQLLSDTDLLCSHYLQEFSPGILQELVFSEDISEELNALLEEVLEEYSRPEGLDQDVF